MVTTVDAITLFEQELADLEARFSKIYSGDIVVSKEHELEIFSKRDELRNRNKRVKEVLKRGWESWHRSLDFYLGYVEDPNVNPDSLGGSTVANRLNNAPVLEHKKVNYSEVRNLFQAVYYGLGFNESILVYSGAYPRKIWDKYKRDKGLFDNMFVASSDLKLFERKPDRITVGDPLLIGEIDKALFIGASWELDKDFNVVSLDLKSTK